MPIQTSDNKYSEAKFIVNPTAGLGTHTTIGAAIAAASSGDIIFIYQGTYTENLTMKAGVTLTAWDDANGNGNVTIVGKVSMNTTGICAFSCINFQTNGDYAIEATGTDTNNIYFEDCSFLGTDHNIIHWTNTNNTPASNMFFYNSSFDVTTTGINYFDIAAGSMGSPSEFSCYDCVFSNSGGSSTANTVTSGVPFFYHCEVSLPTTVSASGGMEGYNSNFFTSATNSTAVTHSGSGSSFFIGCLFSTGTATAISCGGTIPFQDCTFFSTNTNTISGAGTFQYSGINFSAGSTKTISTTNQSATNGDSFTPVLSFGGASVGITYSVQAGSYLRVDNICHFYVDIELSNKGSSVGTASISGLPFASRNANETDIPITIISLTAPALTTYFYGDIATTSTSIDLIAGQAAVGGFAALDNTNFANDTIIRIQGSYFI